MIYHKVLVWYIKRHVVTIISGACGAAIVSASSCILWIVVKHIIPIMIEQAIEPIMFDTIESHHIKL